MSAKLPLVGVHADQGLIHRLAPHEAAQLDASHHSASQDSASQDNASQDSHPWFDLNPAAELLAEHFPGFAVVPASIIYALVVQSLAQRTNTALWQLQNLRLQRPWQPGLPVRLRLEPHQAQWHFALEQAGQGLLCRGVMLPVVCEVHHAA